MIGVNELSLHPGHTAPAAGFSWFMPPIFPPPWASSAAPKLGNPLHAFLSFQNLASLGLGPVVGLGAQSPLNHHQQTHAVHGSAMAHHPLNLAGLQSLPQNLSSRKKDRPDEDSNSSEDEAKRQLLTAEVIRLKAEDALRNDN
ncbi:uncharacterized protein LOC106646314 [Copidosoma floridanum]|uniref:uncharacterized protein LOC106646314 n=1 Tax=Copidosoma floridanum TaxID=29053 RepID=UPI000C6F6A6C|nr:uncharacterized protein LOC106646314 [Copidosoma floridanum]